MPIHKAIKLKVRFILHKKKNTNITKVPSTKKLIIKLHKFFFIPSKSFILESTSPVVLVL